MNKLGYQPLPVLLRAEPSDARWSSVSARILRVVATLGTIIALCGAVAICLIAFNAFPPRKVESKVPVDVPVPLGTKVSPTAAADQDNGMGMPLTDANQAHRGTIAEDHSIIDQTPTPAPVRPGTKASPTAAADQDNAMGTPLTDANQVHRGAVAEDHSIIDQTPTPALNPVGTPTPVAQSEASVSDSELLKEERPEAGPINVNRQLPEATRKKLEKERRQAERRRSRLEEMYRKDAISSEAYNKGEERYKSAIEKYRREMNVRTEPKNEVEPGKTEPSF
jgi:hypothetical protein